MNDITAKITRGAAKLSWLARIALAAIVFAFVCILPASSDAATQAREYRMAGDAVHMRIVMELDKEPDIHWFLLRDPHRLVIDLADTSVLFDPENLAARGLVAGVRYGGQGDGAARLILTAKGPFEVTNLDIVKTEDAPGFRLVAELEATSETAFEQALAVQAATTGSTVSSEKAGRLVQAAGAGGRHFTIVLDPGHGGADGGAEGLNGTVEKTITLAFALELRKKLVDTGKYDVFMTRDRDEFLRLDERVRIARQYGADLFISIHADTISQKGVRGATVYTVSDKASDAEAEALAVRENLSDAIAGISVEQDNEQVADILIDLIRRETHSFSIRFARSLVGELTDTVGLINNPHRYAGFRVLKAPDVPSVLIELGYLSNARDEELLRNVEWRAKAADSIIKAIALFSAAKGS